MGAAYANVDTIENSRRARCHRTWQYVRSRPELRGAGILLCPAAPILRLWTACRPQHQPKPHPVLWIWAAGGLWLRTARLWVRTSPGLRLPTSPSLRLRATCGLRLCASARLWKSGLRICRDAIGQSLLLRDGRLVA